MWVVYHFSMGGLQLQDAKMTECDGMVHVHKALLVNTNTFTLTTHVYSNQP